MTTVYLDENLSQYVAEGLHLMSSRDFNSIEVKSTKTAFGKGTEDEIIIPKIGAQNGILITFNIDIKRTRLQYNLCKQSNLGVFFLTLPKGKNRHWDIVKCLINNWMEIIDKIRHEKRPFAFRVKEKGRLEPMN